MHKFVRSLITEWRKLDLPLTGRSVVAVSGGADSVSLVLALADLLKQNKLDQHFVVAHFNHKLRGRESDADEALVKRLAADLGLEFVRGSARIPRRGNLEQNARDARYRFLLETAHKTDAQSVLVAHTVNDQAETFLMNLIRGSGADGLAAMRPIRPLDESVVLVRPLLRWAKRDDTERICRDLQTKFRNDPMNADERFTRVRIRKQVIPLLADLNPRIIDTLARTAEMLAELNAEKIFNPEPDANNRLKLSSIRRLSKPEMHGQIRAWLRQSRGHLRGLQLKHIEAIERLVLSRKSGNTAELPSRERVVKRSGWLSFTNIKVEK